ncbi:reverse transcriptase domain-containing protein [Trichonephila clavipes]|nr:reverse transcriptase domain-containing protein [Trichonephila clavipes]
MPAEWEDGSLCPICKNEDKLDCMNYRGITLLNTYTIFLNILAEQFASYASRVIGEHQCGFQKGRSITDKIHSIKQILENTREYNIDTYQLFIEFKTAYNSIIRETVSGNVGVGNP